MSATLAPAAVVLADEPAEPQPVTRWVSVVVAAVLGVLVIGLSFRFAAQGDSPQLYYLTFWAGMLLALGPAGAVIMSARTSPAARLAGVTLVALLTAVPKYLRNPSVPLYHDEYAHWRQAFDVLQTGHLFRPNNIIPIVQYFPGTSALTATLQRFGGLSIWSSGQLLVLAVHVLSLFAVFILVGTQLRSDRAGGIAALVYALNPSAIYFDTQYAYESVAIGLFLWTLALAGLAARGDGSARFRYLGAAALCAAACVVTHHLTTLALLGVLLGIAVFDTVHTRRTGGRKVWTWWLLLGITAAVAGVWLGQVAWDTVTYLSPYVGGSVSQLGNIAGSGGGGGRTLLAANAQPTWERAFTALAPLTAGIICLRGLVILRKRRGSWSAVTLALVAFGLVYFPSVPFVLAPSGAEGARRSWAFSYLGVALVFALVAVHHTEPVTGRRVAGWFAEHRRGMSLAALGILLIGNVGAGLNDPYRFPGRFLWGSDTRSASPEARTVAAMLSASAGNVRIVSDRYTALSLSTYGGFFVATPSEGFPVWQLFESDSAPDQRLVDELVTSHFEYLVLDTRMYTDQAFNGNNFGSGDPEGAGPVPAGALAYLDSAPWASKVLSTTHLRVYRLDFSELGTAVRTTP